jgi:uncharacterized protein DUF4349
MRRRSLIVIAGALVAACTVERSASPMADSAGHGYAGRQEQKRFATRARVTEAPRLADLASVSMTKTAEPSLLEMPTNMIIRTASASIEVDSLRPAIALVNGLATRLGGYVASSDVETGKNQLRQADIEVKIPAARFDEAISGLTPIGKLESVNVDAQDVGEEFVDVNARMDNARRLERRLIDLLANRTGKLKDVLDVEQSLARVREEIERYEGRIRYLQVHTAMSTLSITVHEPPPVVGSVGTSVMGEAFRQSWRNFVALVSVLVQSLGVVIPLAIIAGVVWAVSRRYRLARQRTA